MAISKNSQIHEDLLMSTWRQRRLVMVVYVVMLWVFTGVASAYSRWPVETLPGYAGKLPFKMETGYIGVGDMEEVQSFYYFIESERDPQNDPLMLWLTGGPGCSALSGFIFEIGPLAFNYTNLYGQDLPTFQLNPYSWTKVANIIFLDSPVGTVYSYSTTAKGYYSTTSLGTHHIHEFLRRGYVLGNPYTNANSDCNARVKYAHRISLISDKLYEDIFHGLYMAHVLEPNCATASPRPPTSKLQRAPTKYLYSGEEIELFHNLKRRRSNLQLDDHLPEFWCRNYNYIPIYVWTNDKNVQEALHVSKGMIHCQDSQPMLITRFRIIDVLPTSL